MTSSSIRVSRHGRSGRLADRGRCVPSHLRQGGVSLVEVLVAIVVLSIGLLGLAGLQASGMRVGQSSIYRSQAAQLADDMVDRIRVNLANSGSYNLAMADSPQACDPNAIVIANCDLVDWRARLQTLPSGNGAVTVAGSRVTVVVQWDDARGAAEPLLAQFQLTAQLAN